VTTLAGVPFVLQTYIAHGMSLDDGEIVTMDNVAEYEKAISREEI
jgi:hypothetical protein